STRDGQVIRAGRQMLGHLVVVIGGGGGLALDQHAALVVEQRQERGEPVRVDVRQQPAWAVESDAIEVAAPGPRDFAPSLYPWIQGQIEAQLRIQIEAARDAADFQALDQGEQRSMGPGDTGPPPRPAPAPNHACTTLSFAVHYFALAECAP